MHKLFIFAAVILPLLLSYNMAFAGKAEDIGEFISFTRLSYDSCTTEAKNQMRYAEVLPHKHDISKVAECRKENSEAVNARYKNIKKIMGKDIKARDALSSLYTSWMQSMLSVVPKGIVYPSEYERKADINLRRIQELGDKLIVTYCKQNMECASAINDNTKY